MPHLAAGVLATAMLLTTQVPVESQQRASQQRVAGPGETQFNLQLLRPTGGPVIPISKGGTRSPTGLISFHSDTST